MNISKLLLYLCLSLIAAALTIACNLEPAEAPVQTEEKSLTSTATLTPSIILVTFTQASTLAPAITKTSIPSPTHSSTPNPSSTSTPTAKSSITLFLSLIGRHGAGDKFYFHTLLNREEADFLPGSIYVTDQGQISGPFALVEKSELQFCPGKATSNQRIFETEAIDKSDLPSDFWGRLAEESFVYHINIKEVSGAEKVIKITERPGICQSLME